jgi:hypothetical protein
MAAKPWDLAYKPMEPHSLAKWLEGQMKSPREEGENEKGCANKIAINELRLPEEERIKRYKITGKRRISNPKPLLVRGVEKAERR